MAIARVQEKDQQNVNATSHSCTMDSAPTNGNFLVATIRAQGQASAVLVDGSGWTRVAGATIDVNTPANHSALTFWKRAGAGESATQTPATTAINVSTLVYIIEASGVVASGDPVNTTNEAVLTATGTSMQPGSITPSQDGCLLVFCSTQGTNNGGSEAIDSSFTRWADGSTVVVVGYRIQATAAAINPTASWTTSVQNRSGVISAYTPEAGGAPEAVRPRRLVRPQAVQRSYRW